MSTKIEWTDKTWSPIIGCSKLSDGCKNCYAEKFAYRLANIYATSYYESVIVNQGHPANIGKWNKKTYFNYRHINKPYHWKRPRMIFVCSMGDLFHESVPFEWIDKVIDMIFKCSQHTFQILTKRPERALEYFMSDYPFFEPLENVWFGVTVENQAMADKRIPVLLQIPTKVRFVSCEPLLSEIILSDEKWFNYLEGYETQMRSQGNMPMETRIETNKIDWVIAGPETGPGARPMKKEWIESLYQQCEAEGVPFFDKRNELGLNLKEYPK